MKQYRVLIINWVKGHSILLHPDFKISIEDNGIEIIEEWPNGSITSWFLMEDNLNEIFGGF